MGILSLSLDQNNRICATREDPHFKVRDLSQRPTLKSGNPPPDPWCGSFTVTDSPAVGQARCRQTRQVYSIYSNLKMRGSSYLRRFTLGVSLWYYMSGSSTFAGGHEFLIYGSPCFQFWFSSYRICIPEQHQMLSLALLRSMYCQYSIGTLTRRNNCSASNVIFSLADPPGWCLLLVHCSFVSKLNTTTEYATLYF